jgi:predicted AAA+ superfamily ATPase
LSQLDHVADRPDIVLLTGLRRIGKTTIMKQHITRLLEKGIEPNRICYLSLDAYAFNGKSIQDLLRVIRAMHRHAATTMLYLYLDEVTHKDSFRQEMKNLYDLGTAKIVASGSSASLLVDHRAFLTGRSRTIVVNPLDFDEFLLFKGVQNTEKHLLEQYFLDYMQQGGVPEYVLTGDVTYLIALTENILFKDIVAVHGIRKQALIKELFILLCEQVGKTLSYNQLAKLLGTSKDTVKEYVGFFQQTYLFNVVEMRGKVNERLLAGKKLYCADVGLRNSITGFRDKGAIFENLVFTAIKEHAPFFIKQDGLELDFFFDGVLIEAKFNSALSGKQKELFESYPAKKKIVASGVEFFLEDIRKV